MKIYYQELLKRIASEFITVNHYSKLNANEKRIVVMLIEKGYLRKDPDNTLHTSTEFVNIEMRVEKESANLDSLSKRFLHDQAQLVEKPFESFDFKIKKDKR